MLHTTLRTHTLHTAPASHAFTVTRTTHTSTSTTHVTFSTVAVTVCYCVHTHVTLNFYFCHALPFTVAVTYVAVGYTRFGFARCSSHTVYRFVTLLRSVAVLPLRSLILRYIRGVTRFATFPGVDLRSFTVHA